jgi:hypothetical protein
MSIPVKAVKKMGLFRRFMKHRISNDFGKKRENKKIWADITGTRRTQLKIAGALVFHS